MHPPDSSLHSGHNDYISAHPVLFCRCVKSCPVDAWKGTPGYIVSFGGTFGNNIYKGEELLPLIPDKETLFRVTDAAINFFEKNANPSERFRKTLQRVGEEDFRSQLKDAYEGQ